MRPVTDYTPLDLDQHLVTVHSDDLVSAVPQVLTHLAESGFAIVGGVDYEHFNPFTHLFGPTLQTSSNSRYYSLDFHTDALTADRAELTFLYCRRPCSRGGETVLADMATVFHQADGDTQEQWLASDIFSLTDGRVLVRYSHRWLRDSARIDLEAGEQLKEAIEDNGIYHRLESGQIAVVDNRRVLHGKAQQYDERRKVINRFSQSKRYECGFAR